MLINVGEQLVSSYLRYIRQCDFIETNLPTESQGEIDVVGLNMSKQQVYVCEVAIHIRGLQYTTNDVKNGIKTKRPDNVQRLTDKFFRSIKHACKHWNQYDRHFMFWSPIINTSQMRHLEEIKANVKEQHSVAIEFIVNERFQACLAELRNYAADKTFEFLCPLMRLMQIEEHIDKHIKKLTHMQGYESTSTLTKEYDKGVDESGPATGTAPATEFSLTGPEMKALREKAKLTQSAVAVKLGMKPSSSAAISDWEAERVKVPAKHHATLLSLYKPVNT